MQEIHIPLWSNLGQWPSSPHSDPTPADQLKLGRQRSYYTHMVVCTEYMDRAEQEEAGLYKEGREGE